MRLCYRYHRLHAAPGEVPRPLSKKRVALWSAAVVLFLVLLAVLPPLMHLLPVAELLVLAGIGGAAVVGISRVRWRVQKATAALHEAAAKDAFWSPEALRARVEALFEPYWRAVARRDATALADDLTPRWRCRLDKAFTLWRERAFKPVLFSLALEKVEVIDVDDREAAAEDRFVALIECTTSYHVTDTQTGEVIEGFPDTRRERQAWHFVRGERQWLLDRVERLGGGGGAYGDFDFGFDLPDSGG